MIDIKKMPSANLIIRILFADIYDIENISYSNITLCHIYIDSVDMWLNTEGIWSTARLQSKTICITCVISVGQCNNQYVIK